MALMNFVKKQFIAIIHWTEDADGVLAYRFPMQDFEIRNGAQLTVRDTQKAMFVDEGKIAGWLKATISASAALSASPCTSMNSPRWCLNWDYTGC